MHEAAIAQSLIDQATHEIAEAGCVCGATRLLVSVGRLSGVNPDALRFAFEVMARGTDLQGVEIEIEEPIPVLCCQACGARNPTDQIFEPCPDCSSVDIEVEGGRELTLQSIDLEEASRWPSELSPRIS